MARAPEALAFALAAGVVTSATSALGQVTLAAADGEPIEQRIVLALSPSRSTVWVAVHARPAAGGFALVVPARAGAGLDLATDAWLESLEAATAPRILPPPGIDAVCPGDPPAEPLHVAGDLAHHDTLVPVETIAIAGAGDLLLWAAENELAVPGPVASALAASDATHFVALRFSTPGGDAWTPTVRVTFDTAEPVVPLALAQAGSSEQIVTLFAFADDRGAVPGARVAVDGALLAFDAARATSDYFEQRSAALAAPGTFLVESASHDVLVQTTGLPGGATIPSVVEAYFERAAAQGAASGDPAACAAVAASAIERPEPFALACPRADLGVIEAADDCVESPEGDETDPEVLRCGGDADDLALALSGLVGESAWVTRLALRIAPGETGTDREVTSSPDDVVDPTLVAGAADFSGCGEGGGGDGGAGSTSSADATGQNGAGPSGGPGAGPGGFTTATGSAGEVVYVDVPVRVYETTCGCSGDYVIVDYISVSEDEAPEGGSYYAEDDDGCDGDTTESYEISEVEESSPDDEDCSGETSETSESESSSDDGCSGDTSDSSDDSGDDGSADDSGDDSDGTSDDGEGDGGDDGCSCDSESLGAEKATTKQAARETMRAKPKLSVLALGLVAVLTPLRRITRKRRDA